MAKNRKNQVVETPAVVEPQVVNETPAVVEPQGSKRGRKPSGMPNLLTFKADLKGIKNGGPVPTSLIEVPETRELDGFVATHRGYRTQTFPRLNGANVEIVSLETRGYNLSPVTRIHQTLAWNGNALVAIETAQSEVSEE